MSNGSSPQQAAPTSGLPSGSWTVTAAAMAYHFGVAIQRLLMFGWLVPLLATAYAAGVNVWAGGPLDWTNDRDAN
jgi:hypothetical protein